MNRNSQINLNFYFRNNLVYLIIPNIFLRKKETTEYHLAFSAWVPPYSIENLKKSRTGKCSLLEYIHYDSCAIGRVHIIAGYGSSYRVSSQRDSP